MEIKYFGGKTVFLKGKKESVLVDPKGGEFNVKSGARVILYTSDTEGRSDLCEEKILINGSGEYEIGGVEVNGINAGDGSTVYKMTIDDFKIVIIGKIKEELSPKKVEKIDSADVLLVSLQDGQTITYKSAKNLAKAWGVNFLIPVSDDQSLIDGFLDEADAEGLEASDLLKLDKADDLPDGLEVKLLKPTD